MLKLEEYKALIKLLRDYGLDVFVNLDDRSQITYRTMEFPNMLLYIRTYNDTYEITTFFGKSECECLEDLVQVIEYEWNKENWVYGRDNYGEFVELREKHD